MKSPGQSSGKSRSKTASNTGADDADTGTFFEEEGDGKRWVRHRITGQAGWIVEMKGKKYVHPDRPAGVNLLPYREGEWLDEDERRPLTRYQIASVAYEADKALCAALGLPGEHQGYRPWVSLTGDERQRWRDTGPEGPKAQGPRQHLWRTIMTGMQKRFG
jgi:hypothetical protein